jgi:hypothetical protein
MFNGIRLYLLERERIKVRDSYRDVSQEPTRSLAKRYQALCGLDGSKIATQGFRAEQGMPFAFDREFGPENNCVRHHLARPRALRRDSRNRVCMGRADADAETCSLQNFGSANDAKEHAQARLLFRGVTERGSSKNNLMIKGWL